MVFSSATATACSTICIDIVAGQSNLKWFYTHVSSQLTFFSCVLSTYFCAWVPGVCAAYKCPELLYQGQGLRPACILLRSDVYEAGLSSHRRGEVVKLHIRFSTSDVSWIERVVINSNFDQ